MQTWQYVQRLSDRFEAPPNLLTCLNIITLRYVCPTEIIAFSDAAKRFEEVGAKVRTQSVIGNRLSVPSHKGSVPAIINAVAVVPLNHS